ncbi:MAG: hypothetical protein JXA96_17175 [Sedimentisphaerales bacterium]|nr:hypothetical protein [Sedimentisphaerales bacterium]
MNEIAKLEQRQRFFKRKADHAVNPLARRFYAMEVYRCDEDIAQIRFRQLVMRMVVAINVLVLIVILNGCQTVKGVMGDTAWLLQKGSDNIQVQEK